MRQAGGIITINQPKPLRELAVKDSDTERKPAIRHPEAGKVVQLAQQARS